MRLECDVRGRGPLVVLLHGFPMDRSLWRMQVPDLSGRFRVVAPDLRGHGASPIGEGPASMDAMADDVLETLDALGETGRFVVGGLSMGGYVAESLASRFPDRLLGLMLIDTRAEGDTPEGAAGRETLAQLILREGSVEPLAKAMLPKLFAEGARERIPEVVADMAKLVRSARPEAVVQTLRALATRPDRTPDLRGYAMPTLVIAGSDDLIVPLEEAKGMAAAIPGAKFLAVEGAGHVAPLEHPEVVTTSLLAFLDSIEGIR